MNHIVELTQRYPVLLECRTQLEDAVRLLSDCFSTGGKLLICGNEGSCADAQHIVGELMKISFEPSATAGTTMLNESRLPRHARHAAAAASGGAASHCIIGRKRAEHCFLQ
ncbi:SIS domain-containing protein [Ruthenibacterium lactatiformans]|uniref:SIS domain-containing protein n=1 Tax=Ruthenibacterium lactatiformans TaxID=1550024 RepID=UPI00296FB871